MSFKPLQQIIKNVEQQPGWEVQRQYRRLVESWPDVVDHKVAQNTRPLYLVRQVLWVATSNSAWAQTLSLKRQTILKKLNVLIPDAVKQLRFSSAQWSTHINSSSLLTHPSSVPESLTLTQDSSYQVAVKDSILSLRLERSERKQSNQLSSKTPKTAFQDWAEAIELRGKKLPLCPRCQSPSPIGELERWSVCACCIAQHWSRK